MKKNRTRYNEEFKAKVAKKKKLHHLLIFIYYIKKEKNYTLYTNNFCLANREYLILYIRIKK